MNKRKQIAVGYFLRGIRELGGHSITVREFCGSGFVAEFSEARSQRVAAGMFAEDESAAWDSHFFGQDNFVGERVFQDAVLVNARFVGERIGADYGFVWRHRDTRDRGEQAAGGITRSGS